MRVPTCFISGVPRPDCALPPALLHQNPHSRVDKPGQLAAIISALPGETSECSEFVFFLDKATRQRTLQGLIGVGAAWP